MRRMSGGEMHARHIVFFVVAAASPLGFAIGSVPLALGRGGIGTAGMFIVVGLFLALFALGYVAMSRFVVNAAGALFSYVAAGLGRPLGLGTAFVAVLAYALAANGSLGAFSAFAGFEATALFREEAHNKERTVRRAAFLSISVIALFQALVTWSIVQAFGHATVAMANVHPTELYLIAAQNFVGGWLADAITVLVVGSWFASIVAFHSATARYLHVLGRDRAIWHIFARRSLRTGALWVGSLAHTGFSLATILLCIAGGFDPYLDLFVVGSVPVAISIPAMECLTAIAIFAFFRADRRGLSIWPTQVAPALSVLALGAIVWLVLINLPLYTAREGMVNWIMVGLNLVVMASGVARALWMRRVRPQQYLRIGHWVED